MSPADDDIGRQPPRHGRYLPAFLDAFLPGLGHLIAGRRGLAALFGLPIVVAAVALVVVLATTSLPRIMATLVDPGVLIALLLSQGLLLLWRLLAVGSCLLDPRLPRPTRRDAVPILALLALVVVVPQAYAGYATETARETADAVFAEAPSPTPTPAGPTATPEPDPSFLAPPSLAPIPVATPTPAPTPAAPRVNVLLVGVDSAANRNTYATDTMIVASYDPATGTVSMVSIPRDMVDVPLVDGRTYTAKINGLVAYVRHHPRQFPGSDGTGFDVLRGALGSLLGLRIDYHAVVNLAGFVRVIDAIGGINVDVERSFCDPTRHGYGYDRGFAITAGRHHLDGSAALAYARARKAAGESDFSRAARQQEVLSGIRDKLVSGGFVNDPIGLLKALSRTVTTNVPRKLLPDLAEAMSGIDRSDTYRAVITRPMVRSAFDRRGSVQIPDRDRIATLAAAIFPTDGSVPAEKYRAPKRREGRATSSGIGACRSAPAPRPTRRPPPAQTATPTPTATPTSTPAATAKPTATPKPTAAPTPKPTPNPTPKPTATPAATPAPTPTPTPAPTAEPTEAPTPTP